MAARYSIKKEGFFTMNPYAHGSKNKIDIVLHEGGVPSKDAQPQVSLLLGGKALSVQWKMSEKLFSELQASGQGIPRDSSRFMGYSDTMQEMKKAGVVATDGFFRGPPQIIKLGVECTGNPKVKQRPVLTNEKVFYKGKDHVQFNSMYVCTLKVAGDRHGIWHHGAAKERRYLQLWLPWKPGECVEQPWRWSRRGSKGRESRRERGVVRIGGRVRKV